MGAYYSLGFCFCLFLSLFFFSFSSVREEKRNEGGRKGGRVGTALVYWDD